MVKVSISEDQRVRLHRELEGLFHNDPFFKYLARVNPRLLQDYQKALLETADVDDPQKHLDIFLKNNFSFGSHAKLREQIQRIVNEQLGLAPIVMEEITVQSKETELGKHSGSQKNAPHQFPHAFTQPGVVESEETTVISESGGEETSETVVTNSGMEPGEYPTQQFSSGNDDGSPTQSSGRYSNSRGNSQNPLEKINNIRKKANQAKNAIGNIKKVGDTVNTIKNAATAGEIAQGIIASESTPIGWIITGVVVVLFILVVFMAVFIIPLVTSGGAGGSFADCATVPNSIPQIQGTMLASGFNLIGDLSESNNGLHKATLASQMTCNLGHSKMYMSLIGATKENPVNIYIRHSNDCINDHANNPGDGDVCHAGGNNYCVNVAMGCQEDYINVYNLGHELGHIVENRNPDVYRGFLKSVWNVNNRPPLYACWFHALYSGDDGSVTYPAECFADLQGEYLTYNVWRSIWYAGDGGGKLLAGAVFNGYNLAKDFLEYPTRYASYYNFFKDNVFGGVEYKYGENKGTAEGIPGKTGTGLCDPSNFVSSFGSQSLANQASCICKHESDGFAQSVQNTCGGIGLQPDSSPEFSVGLFQINLHVHNDFNSCINVPTVSSINRKISSCGFGGQDVISRNEQNNMMSCLDNTHALDPRTQAAYAYKLYKQVGSWAPWYNSAKACHIL